MSDNRTQPIIIEQTFNVPVTIMWNAITSLKEMQLWYFNNIPEFKAEVGFEVPPFLVASGERNFTHIWKINEAIINKKLTYSWQYKEYSGVSKSIFELLEYNGKTTLKVTCIGLHTFPNDVPEFSRESCLNGWNYFIKERLDSYIKEKYNT